MGSIVSVQFQIFPCSSLYFFLSSIDLFQCLVNVNYRVLTCCTCYFQSGSLFIDFGFLCLHVSQCLISLLTQGGEGCHLFRLICSVLLWGGRNTQTNIMSVCVGCSQCMDGTGFAPARGGVCFTGLHCSGSRLLCRGIV